ncbi:glycosyltransferase [Pseudomonas muyukensis]|uniref:Glycosyltransferase family 2 protein n=1 Tax=Pseudomonas muyukensis TaxID=2842357 RepID=A0ABX8M482_9PSED|nr:glycosyltransferase [Pseudomonas muyukensis]QXH33889.1 glycosyltransferase family 2 protein [Pseudomonas muyukensis]
MSGPLADICILTFAVDRPQALARCIASVAAQQGGLRVEHRILSERAMALRAHPALEGWRERVVWQPLEGQPFQGASSQRMARLRAAALAQVEQPLVAFLDDDNALEPEHLQTLCQCLEDPQLQAAHAWRQVLNPDGTPFPFTHYPWHDDPAVANRMYRWGLAHGVFSPGSPVMRDGVRGPEAPDNCATVDMNEWLFRTECLRNLGFDQRFSQREVDLRVGEDDKLFQRVREQGVKFACSERATVRYYLGGVSNLRQTSGPTQACAGAQP